MKSLSYCYIFSSSKGHCTLEHFIINKDIFVLCNWVFPFILEGFSQDNSGVLYFSFYSFLLLVIFMDLWAPVLTIPNLVPPSDNTVLMELVTLKELKAAVFGMGGGQIPGP